jgi:hypothetical protein
MNTGEYAKLIRTPDRERFFAEFTNDIRPTTDDRPFYFHTTKLKNQFQVAFGRSMLFGNGLSALLTLMGISSAVVVLFVVAPLAIASGPLPPRWFGWLAYFGALGAGFMLIEVSVLQRFVLLLGHPVYSLTVTLFSLLLGTGAEAAWSRRVSDEALGGGRRLCSSPRWYAGDRRRDAPRHVGVRSRGRRGLPSRWAFSCRRHAPGNPDADRAPPAPGRSARHGHLGLGDQRGAVGPRRHARHLHCHELGLSRHAPRRLDLVSARVRRLARRDPIEKGVGKPAKSLVWRPISQLGLTCLTRNPTPFRAF